jgi:resolvase-like protein
VRQTVVIYARVSTDRQNHDTQLAELREYCAFRKWTDVEEVTDMVSGSKSSRQGLDRLMALVRRGKVDIVVCYKLDRLGRSLAHLAALIAEFSAHNVALVVPEQGIDTSGANSAARLQVFVQIELVDLLFGDGDAKVIDGHAPQVAQRSDRVVGKLEALGVEVARDSSAKRSLPLARKRVAILRQIEGPAKPRPLVSGTLYSSQTGRKIPTSVFFSQKNSVCTGCGRCLSSA